MSGGCQPHHAPISRKNGLISVRPNHPLPPGQPAPLRASTAGRVPARARGLFPGARHPDRDFQPGRHRQHRQTQDWQSSRAPAGGAARHLPARAELGP